MNWNSEGYEIRDAEPFTDSSLCVQSVYKSEECKEVWFYYFESEDQFDITGTDIALWKLKSLKPLK